MATVTEPIALDRSLNTTEQTPRNLADVLAQALQMLNTTISGLNFINAVVVAELPSVGISTTTIYLVPSDDPQSENIYDEYINLDGTSAGWEKIGSTEIDLSNYYTKTETDTLLTGKVDKVTGKGLSTNDYTDAEKTKLAGIEAGAEVNPTSGAKTATDSFETVDGGLLSKCVIDLVPVQSGSGDPSPDNVRPISGHTEVDLRVDGENLCTIESGAISTITGEDTPDSNVKRTQGMISVVPNGNYVISGFTSGSATIRIFKYDLYGSFISSYTISAVDYIITLTIPNDAYNIRFQGASGIFTNDVQMRISNLYSINLGGTYYGGYLDVVSGVMSDGMSDDDLSSLSWSTRYTGSTNKTLSTTLTEKPLWTSSPRIFMCEQYKYNGNKAGASDLSNPDAMNVGVYSYYTANGESNAKTLYIVIPISDTPNGKIVYQVDSPQTIQLTPQEIETLAGQNNLSTPLSGQSIETNGVEYKELFTFADVKSYVDKKIPDAPTTDGTYTLQAVISGGVPTYSWV